MDPADDIGPGQHEQVVVPLELACMPGETLSAKRRLVERVLLHHRAHRPIHDKDALA